MRLGEALSLRWRDIDLERGVLRLDENKTDDARAWALSDGAAEALRVLSAEPETRIFGNMTEDGAAELFRQHLKVAGICRPELFERTARRRPIRVHDLRATFITLSLALGRSEAWVADRTGHRSSQMINRYRRPARQAEELGLGGLVPLNEALPDLPVSDRVNTKVNTKTDELRFPEQFRVGRQGLEPWTYGLKVRSSTD